MHAVDACDPLESAARALPQAFVLGAAALCRAADGTIARYRVMFMHVALFECITCVRGHRPRRASAAAAMRAAVRVQRERCWLSGRGCDECDAEHPGFCMVLRSVRAVRGARGGCVVFPTVDTLALRSTRLRRGGGRPHRRHADCYTVRPLPSPQHPGPVSVLRDGGTGVRVSGHGCFLASLPRSGASP